MIQFEITQFSYFGQDVDEVNVKLEKILENGDGLKIHCQSNSTCLGHTLATLDLYFNGSKYHYNMWFERHCQRTHEKLNQPKVFVGIQKRKEEDE